MQIFAELAYRERCVSMFALQKFIYADVGEEFGLSAQRIIRVITRCAEAYKARGVGLPLAIVVSRYINRTCPSMAQATGL